MPIFNFNTISDYKYYYNVEATENKYVHRYTHIKNIEDLSDNFICLEKSINFVMNYSIPSNNGFLFLNEPAIKEALLSYKERLLKNKKEIIIDLDFIERQFFCISQIAYEFGLAVSKEGRITLLPPNKAKINKPRKAPKLSQRQIKSYFIGILETTFKKSWNIELIIRRNYTSLYDVLIFLKKAFPKISFEELIQNKYFLPQPEINKPYLEKLWNNPELVNPNNPNSILKRKKK